MRRILLDALPHSGRALLGLVRPRLLSERWYVVRNAVLLLARSGAGASHLDVPSRHPDDRVRLEVVRALRAMQVDEAATTLVVRLLSDESDEVRKNACMLLRGELLGAGAIAQLQRLIADDAQPEEIRTAGVDALSRSPRDEAGQALFELLHPAGLIESGAVSHVRDLAAAALRRSRASVARELFSRGLASPIRRVRRACERAAGVPG
jgi:HEAT repeat protein